MTEAQAKKARQEFEALARKHSLWFEVKENHKPKLKDIVITVSIRVTQ